MAARTGMADLILRLRGMVNAGTADYSVGTANYWDDTHLQEVLDEYRVDIVKEPLQSIETWLGGGSVEYTEYRSRYGNLESGTAVFTIEDAVGNNQGTVQFSSIDYQRGIVQFAADTLGSAYYLTGRAYDLNSAAADIWRQKAGHFSEHYDISTDNHKLSRSQLIKQCMEMAQMYELKSQPVTTVITRSDVVC